MKKKLLLLLVLSVFLAIGVSFSQAGQVIFEWDANSESDLAGYRLYQSQTSGSYTYDVDNQIATITAGTETFTLTSNEDGTFYWVLTAFDTVGNESEPSNEVSSDLNFKPPSAPTGCVLRIPSN